jgi:hypothetical protein
LILLNPLLVTRVIQLYIAKVARRHLAASCSSHSFARS